MMWSPVTVFGFGGSGGSFRVVQNAFNMLQTVETCFKPLVEACRGK